MRCCFPALALFCCGALAQAQALFPNKPIRLIVTSPAGGANDILNRTLGAKLSESIGQPVLIDNKPGASGFVAAEMVARAPADGYTLLGATEATLVSNPLFFKKVPYDTQRDFAPVTMAVEVNYVLLVHPAVPANSVRELIALARSKRSALAPELPTVAESGLPGFELTGWFGTVAPAGTPTSVIAKLNGAYLRALHAPEVRERLEGFGFEVVGNTPEQFASRMRSESQRLARVIEESGARPE